VRLWPRSLQGQLALRLAAVFVVVSAAGIGLLLWQGSEAADDFGLQMLRYRAEELARYVRRAPDGRAAIVLPQGLARLYSDRRGSNLIYRNWLMPVLISLPTAEPIPAIKVRICCDAVFEARRPG